MHKALLVINSFVALIVLAGCIGSVDQTSIPLSDSQEDLKPASEAHDGADVGHRGTPIADDSAAENSVVANDAGAENEGIDPGSLGVGDVAPPLTVASWVIGDPINELASGQTYVIEFWATWCPPCRTSMPHLSSLQTQYENEVTCIGVTREEPGVVEEFMSKEQSPGKNWEDVVQYRIAIDRGSQMNRSYMKAAGQSGIPSAFIVAADGIIDWIGHPMAMDEPLAQIVDGECDREAAITSFKSAMLAKTAMADAREKLKSALSNGDFDSAMTTLDGLVEKFPERTDQFLMMKMQVLNQAGKAEELNTLQSELVQKSWDDPNVLNQISWGMATAQQGADLELALKAATRASELRDNKDAAILDTVARVYYEKGDLGQAVAWQTRAVENDGSDRLKDTLIDYQSELKSTTSEARVEDASEDSAATTDADESASLLESESP